jgi:predicted AAA+ superfamily ATPase
MTRGKPILQGYSIWEKMEMMRNLIRRKGNPLALMEIAEQTSISKGAIEKLIKNMEDVEIFKIGRVWMYHLKEGEKYGKNN